MCVEHGTTAGTDPGGWLDRYSGIGVLKFRCSEIDSGAI